MMSEHEIYKFVAQYLQAQHPDVVYRFDLAADLKLTLGQARKHKMLHPNRGYPDLFLAEPIGKYHGLFIEIKKDGANVWKKDGKLRKDPHLEEQQEMLERLEFRGYKAVFGVGLGEVIDLIDEYLEGEGELTK